MKKLMNMVKEFVEKARMLYEEENNEWQEQEEAKWDRMEQNVRNFEKNLKGFIEKVRWFYSEEEEELA